MVEGFRQGLVKLLEESITDPNKAPYTKQLIRFVGGNRDKKVIETDENTPESKIEPRVSHIRELISLSKQYDNLGADQKWLVAYLSSLDENQGLKHPTTLAYATLFDFLHVSLLELLRSEALSESYLKEIDRTISDKQVTAIFILMVVNQLGKVYPQVIEELSATSDRRGDSGMVTVNVINLQHFSARNDLAQKSHDKDFVVKRLKKISTTARDLFSDLTEQERIFVNGCCNYEGSSDFNDFNSLLSITGKLREKLKESVMFFVKSEVADGLSIEQIMLVVTLIFIPMITDSRYISNVEKFAGKMLSQRENKVDNGDAGSIK